MKTISLSLVLIALFPYCALAGQSVSIGVSCTIPAIPGLNAPIMEKISAQTPSAQPAKILVAQYKSSVKTYYVR